MTATTPQESTALAVVSQQTSNLMLSPQLMQQMMAVAKAMADATVTVPQHFRGKPGDCLAVVMQATQWNMNPFAVAQKTHIVNGNLGYEAQLVNAVLDATGAIDGTFKYEYRGDGNALECRVGAVCRGDKEITWGEWLGIASVTTKNSPLWKTNPKQQMGYLQVKNWARAFKPGAILGVYTTDELEGDPLPPTMKHMGTAEVVQPASKPSSETAAPASSAADEDKRPAFPQEDFDRGLPIWKKAAAKLDVAQVLARAEAANPTFKFTEQQKAVILSLKKDSASESQPVVTFAHVADAIAKAKDMDALAVAGDQIRLVADDQQRTELQAKYDERECALTVEG